jgi:hypothetical protein
VVPLIAIMGIAGHRSMATTRRYVHLAGVVFRDEATLLERRLPSHSESEVADSVSAA